MSVLIVQHVASEPAGWWGDFLEERNISVTLVRPDGGDSIPQDSSQFAAVLSLGGPMNVYEEAEYPWLRAENALIESCLSRGTPFLGVCLGSQLLAKAAGAVVTKSPAPEIGWYPVALTAAGADDPLFDGLPAHFSVFQWHGDTFDIPADTPYGHGIHLALSADVPHQALRIGGKAYGLQFHVEVTPPMVSEWINLYKDDLARQPQAQDAQAMRERACSLEFSFKEMSRHIFDNFCRIAGL